MAKKTQKRTALQVLMAKLDGLPAREVAPPPIPVERLIREARALIVVAMQDRDDSKKDRPSGRAGERDDTQSIDTRDRAATLLVGAMTEIRATGAYVFRRKPRRVVKYYSAYNTQRRTRRRGNAPAPSAPEETPA